MVWFFSLWICFLGVAQQGHLHTVAFYNVENLFDPHDHPTHFDDDYTPTGKNRWTQDKLHQKIDLLASVISKLGKAQTQRPPLLIGLAEVENKAVLKLLTTHPSLKASRYGIVHFESPDFRGIDVALLYQKDHFKLSHKKAYALELVDAKTGYKRTSRDILVVSGYLNRHKISLLVNHWPSRRGGAKKSAPSRFKAALLHKKITDSLHKKHPNGKIISMGDFNDDPHDKSLQWIKGKNNVFFNPMEKMAKKGKGSLAHNDRWHLFDQLLFSKYWQQDPNLFVLDVKIYQPLSLRTLRGRYRGYPFRTAVEGTLLVGYSDHFPVYAILAERKD